MNIKIYSRKSVSQLLKRLSFPTALKAHFALIVLIIASAIASIPNTAQAQIMAQDLDLDVGPIGIASPAGGVQFNSLVFLGATGTVNSLGLEIGAPFLVITNPAGGVGNINTNFLNSIGNSVTFAGQGSLNLTGASSFTGGFNLLDGLVALNNNLAVGTGPLTAADGTTIAYGNGFTIGNAVSVSGTVNFAQDLGTATQAGIISGSGGIEKEGAGTLVLSGSNTFTGSTIVNGGTLSVTGSVASSTVTGNNNSFIEVAGTSISDTASVTLNDTSNLTLTSSETIGSLTGDTGTSVTLGGNTLTTGDATNTTFAGVIAGTGSLTKEGTGIFTLTGNNTFTGTTTVNNGTLIVDGALAGDVTVNNGATLAGSGTFGVVTIGTSSIIAPGNSVGVINTGDLTLDAGSTLVIEVSQAGADQVNVTGTVTINGGTVQFIDLAPALQDTSQSFVFINNDGTDPVQGTGFGNIIDDLAFLTPEVSLTGGDGNDVVLSFAVDPTTVTVVPPPATTPSAPPLLVPDLSTVAGTPNQSGAGTAFNSLDPNDPAVQAINDAFLPLSISSAQDGLNNLTGETFGSANFATNTSGLFVGNSIIDVLNGFASGDQAADGTQTALNREASVLALALAPDETAERLYAVDAAFNEDKETEPQRRRYVFSRGLFRDVQVEADGNGAETDVQNRGFVAGGGLNFNERFSAGLGAGFLRTEVDVDSLNEEIDGNGAILNAHARLNYQGFDLTGTAGYLYNDFSSERIVTVGAVTQAASANFDAHTGYASGEIGYTALLSGNIALRPFVGGSFSVTRRGAFTETGAGAANLSVAASTDILGQFNAGLSASTSFNLGSVLIVPRVEGAVDILAGDVTPETTATFSSGGLSFTSTGTTPGRTRGRASAGFATKLTKNVTGFLNYQGVFSENDREHAVRSGLRVRF